MYKIKVNKGMNNFFKAFLIALVIISNSINSVNAQTVTTTLDATVRDMSDVNFGFNRRSNPGTWFSDASFKSLVAEMNPDVLRFPGGTQGNYWDWSTGEFIPNTDKAFGTKEKVTMQQFMNVKPAETKIIFMVNLARPTPATGIDVNATEAVLKSQATLDAKIEDMIDAIDEFVALGQEPYAVEVGNEFYFGNEEAGIFHIIEVDDNGTTKYDAGWDPTANNGNGAAIRSNSKKDATEVNAKFYLQQAKDVVAGIKAVYPNIKFALISTKRGNGTSARERWNDTIFDELENNTSLTQLQQDVYALTQHHYINDGYNAYGVSDTNAAITDVTTAKQAIAEGIQYAIDKQPDYNMVPNDYKIWFTEYGATKGNAEDTWAAGMRYAALTYSWLSLGDKTNQLDFHHLVDNNVVKVGSPMLLAPVGITSKQFMLAASGMNEMQQINFDTNPTSVGNVKALYGYKFKNAEKETLLILNLNENSINSVKADNLFTYSGVPTMTQYSSNDPWVSAVALGDTNILFNDEAISTTFNARKFSITVIEVQNIASLPVAPSNLVAVEVNCTSIGLTWVDNSDNETGFRIKQSIDGAPYTQYYTTTENSTSYSATGLDENKTYNFRVIAYNSDGNSTLSQGNTLTTSVCPTSPADPSSFVATEVDCTSVDLVWLDNSDNENGFEVEQSTDGGINYTSIYTSAENSISYSVANLNESTSYDFRIRSFNATGNSSYISSNNITTSSCLTLPTEPSNLVVTEVDCTSIDLTWTDNSDNETGFRIKQSIDGAPYTQYYTTTENSTSYSAIGLDENKTYNFRVIAYNSDGNSTLSQGNIVTTSVCPTSTTLSVIQDAYVRNGSYKNTNYGTAQNLQVRQTNTNSAKRYTYLKFDVSNVSNITSATLRVNNTGSNGSIDVRKVSNDNWSESNIKWKNKPSLGSYIDTFVFNNTGTFDIDVTSYVSAEKQGNGIVSFVLKGSTSNYMAISSKEAGNGAQLIIEQGNSNAKTSNTKSSFSNIKIEDDNLTSIFPNPTNSLLNFKINNADLENGKIQIFDITGRLIQMKKVTSENMQINLNGPTGIYIVKIQNKTNSIIRRIVKK